jgi:hypothetical protein
MMSKPSFLETIVYILIHITNYGLIIAMRKSTESENDMNMSYTERIDLVRCYEVECYRICNFILDCEQLALTATQMALFHLLHDEAFFFQNDAERTIHTQKVAKKAAIQTHFNLLTATNNLEPVVL